MADTASSRTDTAVAPIQLRRDAEIYATDGGWFRARWHFSFDQYRDPENMGIGTLRVFNHDTLVAGAVWPMHPHRDVEGITYVLAGEFEHADSLGYGGVLLPGGVQRMSLGSGAYHSERNHSQTEEMQFIQMWIMPEERGLPPSIEQQQYLEEDRRNRLLRILHPEGSDGEGVSVHRDVSMYVSRLEPGASVEHGFSEGRGGYFYLISGEAEVNSERLRTGDAAYVLGAGRFDLNALEVSELILVDTPL
ncbi:MAG TPA: pirin family protein [Dehalococcoidia bacterium]|nr:pirin family protein [Dehalococcoidia bacterium]